MDKINFSELLTKYELEPTLIDIYVEGAEDELFYRYHMSKMGCNHNFIDISSINFDNAVDLTKLGWENNNRDKIIYLLLELNKIIPENKVYGIIDRDILKYTRGINCFPKNLFLTDFSCIEMYYFCPDNVNKIKIHTFRCVSEKEIKDFMNYSAFFSFFNIVEKRKKLSIKKINPEKISSFIDYKKNNADIDKYVLGCLSQSSLSSKFDEIQHAILQVENELKNEDPQLFINGHIFVNILTGFISKNKKYKHIKSQEVQNIYKASVETVFLVEYDLFKSLKKIK